MYSQSSAVICEEEEAVSCCRGHSLGMFNAAAVALALYPFNYFYGSYSTRGQCFVVTEGWSVPLTIGRVNVTSIKHLYWSS